MKRTFLFIVLISAMNLDTSLADEPTRCQPIAHRGLLLHAPENTLANFAACQHLRLGFEFDVRRTKDGALVCLHDDTLDRTTTGKGPLLEKTLTELSPLDAGSWFDPSFKGERIPAIEQLFRLIRAYPNQTGIFTADLKADDEKLETDIVKLALERGVLNQILFIGRAIDNPDVRARLRKADPKCHVACLAQTRENVEKAMLDRDSDWVYVRFVPDADVVKKIRAAGKKTIIAGPKVSGLEKENWSHCVAAGVDAILTDYPLECRTQMREEKEARRVSFEVALFAGYLASGAEFWGCGGLEEAF
jgi:glycerophosphoryl diester phosphodiesterase